jgi:hypothetical protein
MFLSVHVPRNATQRKEPGTWSSLLKFFGAVSATVSLLLILNQATGVLQGFRIHHKEFWEAMKIGEQAQERKDYPAAFAGFKRAVELDPIDRKAQERETKAAMLWLENAHGSPSRSFTDTADQLLPVLDRGLANAKGAAAADILAHIGWANFLRYRDGAREGVDVDGSLERAISIDKNNPYAQAMSGFWILWQGGSLDTANTHFAAALVSGRERVFVRELQVDALNNRHRADSDIALLRVANEMRKNGESMPQPQRASVLFNVFDRMEVHDELVATLSVLPPAETEATVNWLCADQADFWSDTREGRPFIVANLREIAGDRAQALILYRSLQKELAGSASTLRFPVDEAVKRLSAKSK